MRKLGPCFFMIMTLLLGVSTLAHATPPVQEPTPPPTQNQADSLLDECVARYSQSDFRGALESCQAALPLYQQVGDRYGEAMTLVIIGANYRDLSDYEQALAHYQQALPIWQEIGDRAGEAATLLVIGASYRSLSDYEQALIHLQQALTIWREIGDQRGESETLNNIGAVYDALFDYEQALAYYEQALPIWQEIGDRAGEATTLLGIGKVYHALSNYEEALAYLQQALDIKQGIGDRYGEATTLSDIGLIYRDLSDYEQALTYLRQALTIWQEIGDRRGEATTLVGIGAVYDALSDYEQALACFEQALPIWQEIGNRQGEAATLNNIGAIYHALSDYEQALAYYKQSLPIRQEIGDRRGEAVTMNNIGMVYQALSDYEQALVYLRQALPIRQEIGDRVGEATTLNNIGMVYQALPDYEQALAHYKQALAIFQMIGDRAREAATLDNIGAVYRVLPDYEQALAYLQQALPISREIGDRAGEAATLHNLGGLYYNLSDYERALAYYEQALLTEREIGNRAMQAVTLNNIGTLHYDLSDYEQALAYFEQALAIQQEIGDRREEATTLGNLGNVYEAQGQEKQALEYALQVIAVLESIHGELKAEALQTAFAAGKTGYYYRVVRLLLAQDQTADAFHYAERGRARTFLTLLGNQRVDPKGSEDPGLIQQESELRNELTALESHLLEEWSKPADQLSKQVVEHVTANLEAGRQEYENLLTQLQLTNPEYAALVSVDPLTLEETQGLLREEAPDVTLLAYFVGEEETTIFVLGLENYHAQAVSVTREELRGQAEALLAQMRAAPLLPNAWREPPQTLYGWLIAPVQKYLPHASAGTPPHLGIIPHDLLHYLPFGLLYDGKYTLLEGYTLFYAPSASSLRFIFEKRHPEVDTLLAFANPDAPGTSHLSYAVAEAEAVTALYDTEPVIGAEATEARFKNQAGEYGLVHVAAHSDYNPHNPLFSAILLAEDDKEDGRLETHEVFNLDLPQTDLVVLSACETHLGELGAGDELVGLERAFIRAGSPSLLTTLWPVDDAAAAQLMERFYTHLRTGVPKAEALRLAQLETRAENPEPYYWAGFVLVGDAGAGPAAQPGQWIWVWGAVIALLVAVGVVGWQIRRRRHK